MFSSPTASLTSCAGSNRWWSAGSPFQQVLSPGSPAAPPGRRLRSCPNLAFLLQRVREGKERETDPGGLAGTEENQEHGGEAGGPERCSSGINDLMVNLTLCCQPPWRQSVRA